MRISTFFFLTRRGLRNLGKHWAMTIACIASLSVCMTLNSFASLAEVNVDSMVSYLGSQNETVVYLDPDCDDATATQVGEKLSTMPGVSGVQYVSKQDVLNIYRGYMEDYSSLWDEFESDNPFKANYRVTISDLSQMAAMSKKMQAIPGVYSVAAPVEMTNVFVEVQQAVTKGGRLIVLVLMIVSIITVGSTIRLSVFARRREIEIMKYVGATNALVTLPFVVEGLAMGLISGALTAGVSLAAYSYTVSAAGTLGGLWQLIMGRALVPVANVWPTVVIYSLAGGALVGGLLGFLCYNHYPAKVFMGDTGSLFLGGAVAALAFAYDMPLILLLVGFVYLCETLSDIIQVTYFKLTHGKRIFKMAPLHHHFEMCGWKETKIVAVFAAVSALFCVLAYLGVMDRFGA